jgi:hypothetical protein
MTIYVRYPDDIVVREIHGWHTECGSCRYGAGGWVSSPALEGKTPLSTDSPKCFGCGKTFTHELNVYKDMEPRPL